MATLCEVATGYLGRTLDDSYGSSSMTEAQPTVDTQEVQTWFNTLYRNAHGYLHVASSGNWAGQFFNLKDGFSHAIQYVQRLGKTNTTGIFARITTLTAPPEEGKRGGANLSHSLPALWADLDIAGPGHKHTPCLGGLDCGHDPRHTSRVRPLPPTQDAAMSIVDDSGLPAPTLWIHSGGGLYPIWLIDPVHEIGEDLGELDRLSMGWQHVIAAAAERAGYHYGTGIGDLARVLRVPGTWNRKTEDARECRILAFEDSAYGLPHLLAGLADAERKLPLAPEPMPIQRPPAARIGVDTRPGDDFLIRVDWSDILLLGHLQWRVSRQIGEYREWIRPDASSSLSATTGKDTFDNLWVFSTETPFPVNEPISKLEAFRIIHGYASIKDAVKALNKLGFGSPAEYQTPRPAVLEPLEWPAGSTPLRPLPISSNGAYVAVEAAPQTEEVIGEEWAADSDVFARQVVLTPASTIKPERVKWGWRDGTYGRCPVGEITLVPGREGVGKSMFLAWLIANLTRGTLPGEFQGRPRPVLYSTAEDSWAHTVVPRLIAADADLTMVHRIEVMRMDHGTKTKMILPRDCSMAGKAAGDLGAAAIMMDPIISLIDDDISVNQSAELRRALEPLRDAAERHQFMVIALAHFNKMSETDVLSKIPGARAWAEVARAAIALAADSDEGTFVASQVKNNLGRTDLPNLTYRIDEVWIDTDEGPATADTGKLVWTGTTPTGVNEILERRRKPADRSEKINEVVEFVAERYGETGHVVSTSDVIAAMPHRSEANVRQILTRAFRDKLLERPVHGHYKPVEGTEGE